MKNDFNHGLMRCKANTTLILHIINDAIITTGGMSSGGIASKQFPKRHATQKSGGIISIKQVNTGDPFILELPQNLVTCVIYLLGEGASVTSTFAAAKTIVIAKKGSTGKIAFGQKCFAELAGNTGFVFNGMAERHEADIVLIGHGALPRETSSCHDANGKISKATFLVRDTGIRILTPDVITINYIEHESSVELAKRSGIQRNHLAGAEACPATVNRAVLSRTAWEEMANELRPTVKGVDPKLLHLSRE